jgi:hypothetical protein
LAALARRRVDAMFGGTGVARREPLRELLQLMESRGWTVFLFGGTVRDLVVLGDFEPRDVDLVVDEHVTQGELERTLRFCTKRRTRFGGLHLEWHGWLLDIWRRPQTWALAECPPGGEELYDLPATTFLNVEAILVELTRPQTGGARRLFEHGFFDGVVSKTVEVNLVANPFPALCVVRSLVTARKLRFMLGPRLGEYILRWTRQLSLSAMLDAQVAHYGQLRIAAAEIEACIGSISEQLSLSTRHPIHLPRIPDGADPDLPLWRGRRNDYAT